jgi:5-enolpyruvylshikimate-3-phosphate synthase
VETLKRCLDEIRACRPFFIGLLGERYGWVPGGDAFTADVEIMQQILHALGVRVENDNGHCTVQADADPGGDLPDTKTDTK